MSVQPSRIRLSLRGICVRRGGREVLRGLDLDVGEAEIVGLLGANGAGKTTAFHVLTGLLPADAGEVVLDGEAMPPGDRRVRAAMGVVFQDPALDPRLSARRNLELSADLFGVPAAQARARIDGLLLEAGLADRAGEAVKTFSGGMRRRVEIARALVHEPAILVLDEPSTGLDEAAFRRTWETFERLRSERGMTLLLTTHRADEAERCDRIAILDGGRRVAFGTPDELRRRVRGDLVVLDCAQPAEVAEILQRDLLLSARVLDGRVVLEHDRAHTWIPRIVEALPDGTLSAVQLRRTGMGEVYLELTGHELDRDSAERL